MSKNRPVTGLECIIAYDSASSTASPTWVEIPQAQDVSEPSAMEEVEASCKASVRKRYLPGQEDAGIEFDYLFVQGGNDEVFNFMHDKYHTREPIHMASADGPMNADGTLYLRDWFVITKFEPGQDLGGSRVYAVTMKPTPHFTEGVLDEYSYDFVVD